MGVLGWVVMGLGAGAIARLIFPGKQHAGCFLTMLLGIAGGVLGGWIGDRVLHIPLGHFYNLRTWFLAILGALALLTLQRLVTSQRRRR